MRTTSTPLFDRLERSRDVAQPSTPCSLISARKSIHKGRWRETMSVRDLKPDWETQKIDRYAPVLDV